MWRGRESWRTALLALGLVACEPTDTRRDEAPAPLIAPSLAASSRARGPGALPPLGGHGWLEPLQLGRGRRGVVAVPLGAEGPRPIVVGVHGAGDRAEWACGGYRIATRELPFVVCPEGLPVGGGKFSTALAVDVARDASAAIAQVRAVFGAYVAPGPAVLAAFSLGAIQAVEIVRRHAALYPRVLLIEGGARGTPDSAQEFVSGGGERVLLVCAAARCDWTYEWARKALAAAGARVEVVAAGTGRHNLDGEMMRVLEERWGWLIEGDPRWAAWRARP